MDSTQNGHVSVPLVGLHMNIPHRQYLNGLQSSGPRPDTEASKVLLSSEGSGEVSFHHIDYTISQGKKCGCVGEAKEKKILRNINGIFKPGMNAILGPTGSGKTSLLDVLAGRKDPRGLKGTVLIDGHAQPVNFKCMSGYVVQDDVVMGTLTVRENLAFSATLRMRGTTKEERKQLVNNVIEELALGKCADTKIGNEFIRGVSGGEKKRCSIGMELIIQPRILFLDEPTTGLDANTAHSVMILLHRLSRRNRTIIFSIHQPRYSIFHQFDMLMLLSDGEVVYHGDAASCLDYFSAIGYECEPHNNPPDFFLDVINGTHQRKDYGSIQDDHTASHGSSFGKTSNDELASLYTGSEQSKKMLSSIDSIITSYDERCGAGTEVGFPIPTYARSSIVQLVTVSKRTVLNVIRDPFQTFFQMFVTVLFGLIVGTIYYDMDSSLQSGVQNRVGIFFFIVMNMVFGNMSAISLFVQERANFIHENISGYYQVSAYFISKVLFDLIPVRIIPTTVFTIIVYFMTGLSVTVEKYFFFLLILCLSTLSACGLAFCISSCFNNMAVGNSVIALTYVFMMVFSGLLVNIESIVVWLRWLKYISIFRYGLSALSINELKDMEFCGNFNGTQICQKAGNDYLTKQGIPFETAWDKWQHPLAMAIIAMIGLLMSYLRLRFMHKLK